MTYKDIAPGFNKVGVKESEVLAVKSSSKGGPIPPKVTKAKAQALLADFAGELVPHTKLAQKHGLSTSQVRRLHAEYEAVQAANAPKEVTEI